MANFHRIYLDQMFSLHVAREFTKAGHDVVRASEYGQERADDKEILARAVQDRRILITLDEHFGDWVILPLDKHNGVIRLKINPATSDNALMLVGPFLKKHVSEEFRNHLVILSSKKEKWIITKR